MTIERRDCSDCFIAKDVARHPERAGEHESYCNNCRTLWQNEQDLAQRTEAFITAHFPDLEDL